MRSIAAAAAVAVLSAVGAGCLADPARPELGSASAPIIGGTVDTGDPAVVMLYGHGYQCTGTLVAPNVILTAGHCLESAGTAFFGNGYGDFFDQREIAECYPSRHYAPPGTQTGEDIALCRLTTDAPVDVAPLPMNQEPLDDSYAGAEIRSVGFGISDPVANTGSGLKRQVSYSITEVRANHILAGDSAYTICNGDSGGPVFHNFGAGERIIAVHSYKETEICLGTTGSTRVDIHMGRFLQQVMDAWYGPCKFDGECVTAGCTTPDPDCGTCGFDGRCDTGCDTKDLDCPIGAFAGGLCDDREDCESLLCIDAPDDTRVHYCSTECDPDRPEQNYGCDPPLNACRDDGTGSYVCQYPGITPSVQGSACDDSADCRSGLCDHEDGICVEACGDGLPECPEEYTCDAVSPEVDACVLPREGGGGICEVGRVGRRGGSASGLLIGLALLGLIVVGARRRRGTR